MNSLKEAGCSLVFFSSIKRDEVNIEEQTKECNEMFEVSEHLYDDIGSGMDLQQVVASLNDNLKIIDADWKKFDGHSLYCDTEIVQLENFGEFFNTVHKRNPSLAQYATRHNALAIISDNSELFIFEGSWKLWWSDTIQISPQNELEIIEYDRVGLSNILSISQNQLPLFATLMSNEYTRRYSMELDQFRASLGDFKYKFQNVARFVRSRPEGLLNSDIEYIFGRVDDEIQQLIEKSLKYYDINFKDNSDDPIERKLRHCKVYRLFIKTMRDASIINMWYYDMKGSEDDSSLPTLLIDWERRNIGIVRQRFNDDSYTLTFIAKKSLSVEFKAYSEKPIYPDCKLT